MMSEGWGLNPGELMSLKEETIGAQANRKRPCEETARRWLSASPGEKSDQKSNLLAL